LSSVTIARNYAEALFDLGEGSGQTQRYADLIDAVAAAVETTPQVQAALMSPRVPKATKARIFAGALSDAPREFVLFLQALVKRGRQYLLREIATQYLALLDIKLNRIRAGVTRPAGRRGAPPRHPEQLPAARQVIASFSVDPAIPAEWWCGRAIHDGRSVGG
jgi:F0F1-type ATP synthase delta subunit